MPRGINTDANYLRQLLEEGVLLKPDRVEGDTIDLDDDTPVYIGIIVNVTGYGPHIGALYVEQNRFHGHPDSALQEAFDILQTWEMETNPEYLAELEEEYGDDALDVLTETFDGWAFKLSPQEVEDAVRGTRAEEFFEFTSEDDDDDEGDE